MGRGVVVVLVSWTVACGGAAVPASPTVEGGTDSGGDQAAGDVASMDDASSDQAGGDATSTDGGEFACGDAQCAASQICLYPAYGCVALLLPDSGVCPEGTEYFDASDVGRCLPPPPSPSCVSPAPGEGSFDCSGGDAGASCTVVNVPIPSGCSHLCRVICV